MHFLNRNEVDNFLAQRGLPPVDRAPLRHTPRGIGRPVQRRRVGSQLSGVRVATTNNWQLSDDEEFGDGWGASTWGRGDTNRGVNLDAEYGQDIVYNPQSVSAGGVSVPATASQPTNPDMINYLQVNPSTFQGSFYLPANYQRGLLLFQNQSAASNLWINFSVNAGINNGLLLTPGLGFLFDVKVPNNAIYGLYATSSLGFLLEGTNLPVTPAG